MYGLTTKYNIHFNGNEAYKEGLAKMEQGFNDDYSRQLILHPVYSLVDLKEPKMDADFDRAIDKCKKSIQTKSISTKPKRKENNSKEYRDWLNRGEWNPFIHNAWVLSGKAQFFEGDFNSAQATFAYTIRHFSWKPQVIAECHIWTARCYAVQGFLYDAETELGLVEEKILSPRLQKEYALAKAEVILQRGENKHEAIAYLSKANKVWQTKEQRLRAQFLIAQLYEGNGDFAKAYESYGKIVRSASNYKTQFNARIAQTRVMPVSDLTKTEKKLQSYRRQKRNSEYLDQVYYALGNVALLQRDTTKAIRQYELALEESTRNGMDKAVAALRLGEICFEQEDYVKAQKAYSMAMSIIKDDYPNYKEIARLSSVLDELQTHAETVQLQDSLLWLASLPESDLNNVIDKIIEDLIKKEKEEEESKNMEAYDERVAENADPLAQNTQQPIVGQKDDSWYFYNTAVVNAGKAEFQRIWGSRRPEDNWRRKNKTEVYFGENTEDEITEEGKEIIETNDSIDTQRREGVKIDNSADNADPHKREYYLAQIPFSDAQKENSNTLIEDGMYNMGVIINEKLENFPLSIHTFESLERRYPDTDYRLEFYYSIYLMYMRMGQKANAEVYRQKLMQKFPESTYAVAVSDPNYIENLRHMEVAQDSLYRKTYEAYLANESEDVHKNYEWVHEHWPLSKLMPKFLFLHALSFVQDGDTDSFRESLEQLTALYPKSDVSPLAGQMVKGIHEGRNIQTGETAKGIVWKSSLRHIGENDSDIDSSMIFVDNDDIPHLLLIAYKTDSISQNDLLFEIAKFNFDNYLIKDFDLEIINTRDLSVLVISSFDNLEELLEYHDRMDMSKSIQLPDSIYMIDISEPNFRALLSGKTFDEYFQWVQETYSNVE